MPHKMMSSQIADVLHDNRLSIEARMLYAYLEEDLGLKRYRMFQAIAYGETAISVELDLYAKLSAMVDRPLVG